MAEIAVYDDKGIQVNSIIIPGSVEYVDGRVYKGESSYYKGIGIPYRYHHIHPDDMTEEYEYLNVCDVFYIGNIVSKKSFQEKTGVFQEKYQPHFTDWIGACGVKELNILENLYDEDGFEMNAVDVFGYETIDETEQQYYLKVDYPNGRNNYITNPNPKGLRNLLDYMIQNDWNFPWDKNSLTDIAHDCKVTDVADIFRSNDLSHKIGSVYSVLHSLYKSNPQYYFNFCVENNLSPQPNMGLVFNSLSILTMNGIKINSLFKQNPIETYKNIVMNYLVTGKNCGFCGVGSCKGRKDSNQSYGEEIREEYIKRAMLDLKA